MRAPYYPCHRSEKRVGGRLPTTVVTRYLDQARVTILVSQSHRPVIREHLRKWRLDNAWNFGRLVDVWTLSGGLERLGEPSQERESDRL